MVTTAFFIAFVLPKLLAIYTWGLFLLLATSYVGWKRGKLQTQRWLRIVHTAFWAALAGLIVHSVALASSQYVVWKSNWLTRHFLSATLPQNTQVRLFADWLPVFRGTGGYFAYYTFTHFVLGGVAVVLAAGAWYSLLKALEKHKSRFFEEGEVMLGFVCALLVGWPAVVLFIPLTFLFFSSIAVVRVAVLKKQFTTIAVPLLLATATTLLVAETIITSTSLKVLKI